MYLTLRKKEQERFLGGRGGPQTCHRAPGAPVGTCATERPRHCTSVAVGLAGQRDGAWWPSARGVDLPPQPAVHRAPPQDGHGPSQTWSFHCRPVCVCELDHQAHSRQEATDVASLPFSSSSVLRRSGLSESLPSLS